MGVAKKTNISKTVPVTPVHDHDHDHKNWVACNKQTSSRYFDKADVGFFGTNTTAKTLGVMSLLYTVWMKGVNLSCFEVSMLPPCQFSLYSSNKVDQII